MRQSLSAALAMIFKWLIGKIAPPSGVDLNLIPAVCGQNLPNEKSQIFVWLLVWLVLTDSPFFLSFMSF